MGPKEISYRRVNTLVHASTPFGSHRAPLSISNLDCTASEASELKLEWCSNFQTKLEQVKIVGTGIPTTLDKPLVRYLTCLAPR